MSDLKNLGYGLSLLGYILLAYLFFVEKNPGAAFLCWVAFLAVKLVFKPFRDQSPLLLIVGLCFIFMDLIGQISWLNWPLDFFLGTALGFILLRLIRRPPTEPLHWGFAFSRAELLSVLVINVPAIAILTWYFKLHPEVANHWPLPNIPLWGIPFVIILIATVNGLREEIFFRGLLQPASGDKNPAWFVIGVQAVLFGFLHFANAFPQGWTGVFLTALWGAAIAIQYRIFKSISLAWVTHSVADAIMFTIILFTRA